MKSRSRARRNPWARPEGADLSVALAFHELAAAGAILYYSPERKEFMEHVHDFVVAVWPKDVEFRGSVFDTFPSAWTARSFKAGRLDVTVFDRSPDEFMGYALRGWQERKSSWYLRMMEFMERWFGGMRRPGEKNQPVVAMRLMLNRAPGPRTGTMGYNTKFRALDRLQSIYRDDAKAMLVLATEYVVESGEIAALVRGAK